MNIILWVLVAVLLLFVVVEQHRRKQFINERLAMTDWEDVVEQADRITDMSEDDLPEGAYDRAADFFDSVHEGVNEVRSNILEHSRVTEKQQEALDNWENGISKWIK